MHAALAPRSYLEIGVSAGRSLALSRTRSIAVDPAFEITSELRCDLELVRSTSDEFFARPDPLVHVDGRIDLAFVDGLHHFEFALRDFMNVERFARWTSVIVVDDVLPRTVAEAARERRTAMWAGDVFKLADVLAMYRPDLVPLALDTDPTGVLLVLGANADDRALQDDYEAIVASGVAPDPQDVPERVLRREAAIDPASVLESGVLDELRAAREEQRPRDGAWPDIRASLAEAVRPAEPRRARAAASHRRRRGSDTRPTAPRSTGALDWLRPLRRRFHRLVERRRQ